MENKAGDYLLRTVLMLLALLACACRPRSRPQLGLRKGMN